MNFIKEFIKDIIIFLVIYFSIIVIGANTGGNRGLKHSWCNFKKSDKDELGLKDILKDLFLVISSFILCIVVIYYFEKYKIVMFLLMLLLLLVFTINFIKKVKQYVNKHR